MSKWFGNSLSRCHPIHVLRSFVKTSFFREAQLKSDLYCFHRRLQEHLKRFSSLKSDSWSYEVGLVILQIRQIYLQLLFHKRSRLSSRLIARGPRQSSRSPLGMGRKTVHSPLLVKIQDRENSLVPLRLRSRTRNILHSLPFARGPRVRENSLAPHFKEIAPDCKKGPEAFLVARSLG